MIFISTYRGFSSLKKTGMFFFLSIGMTSLLFGQVKIGDNPTDINPYLILEIESQDKGVIFPRMTESQRDAAFGNDAPEGTMIFNLDRSQLQVWHRSMDPSTGNPLQTDMIWEDVINPIPIIPTHITPPDNAAIGQLYMDPNTQVVYVNTGTGWIPILSARILQSLPSILTGIGPPSATSGFTNINDRNLGDIYVDNQSGDVYAASDLDRDGLPDSWVQITGPSGTDSQFLTFGTTTSTTETTLEISNGNTLTLQASGSLSFSQTNSNTLQLVGEVVDTSILMDTDTDTLIQVEETTDDDTIRFDTAGIERMVIDSNGNVGIGTPSPSQTFTVSGSAHVSGAIHDSSGNTGERRQVLSSTGTLTSWISIGNTITSTTSNYVANIDDGTVVVIPSDAVTVTLPPLQTSDTGKKLTIKRGNAYTIDADGLPVNPLEIVASGGGTIDGSNSLKLNLSYQGYTLQASVGNWVIIQRF